MTSQSRFSDQFKRDAVRAFVSRGKRTADDIAKQFGVSPALLYHWKGVFGDPKEPIGKSRFTEGFARRAVIGLRDRGDQSVDDYAREIGVVRSVLYRWREQYGENGDRDASRIEEEPNERTGYSGKTEPVRAARQFREAAPEPPRESRAEVAELNRLRAERDKLAHEAAALRHTIVLLSRNG